MVETFNPIVCPPALISLRTLLSLRELTQLRSVEGIVPPPVLDRVVKVTGLMVVGETLLWTLVPLEIVQDQVHDSHWLSRLMMCLLDLLENLELIVIEILLTVVIIVLLQGADEEVL